VLPLFEARHPGDDRPRAAIVAARRFALGDIAAQDRAAAWAAAMDAASTAAWAAARTAAMAWQARRLWLYLTGPLGAAHASRNI
jgi:hypothetical protein